MPRPLSLRAALRVHLRRKKKNMIFRSLWSQSEFGSGTMLRKRIVGDGGGLFTNQYSTAPSNFFEKGFF